MCKQEVTQAGKPSIKKALSSLSSLPNEKVGTDDEIPEMPEFAPDKAILFTYGTFDVKSGDDSAEDRKSFAHHMTNGYRDSYHTA